MRLFSSLARFPYDTTHGGQLSRRSVDSRSVGGGQLSCTVIGLLCVAGVGKVQPARPFYAASGRLQKYELLPRIKLKTFFLFVQLRAECICGRVDLFFCSSPIFSGENRTFGDVWTFFCSSNQRGPRLQNFFKCGPSYEQYCSPLVHRISIILSL